MIRSFKHKLIRFYCLEERGTRNRLNEAEAENQKLKIHFQEIIEESDAENQRLKAKIQELTRQLAAASAKKSVTQKKHDQKKDRRKRSKYKKSKKFEELSRQHQRRELGPALDNISCVSLERNIR